MAKTEINMFQRVQNRAALAIDAAADDLDRIQQASIRNSVISDVERNSDWLREVRTALRPIGAGAFGICVACEADINPKRLVAEPSAARCMGCQEALELERSETELNRLLRAA